MIIKVKVRTNAKKEEIKKDNDLFIVKVNKAPIDGKANERVIELLSKYFKVPKKNINIIKGHKSKEKLIEIIEE
ncbi:MAG: DUF167 domain-containing protein [Nanoarchaeota archaeon]